LTSINYFGASNNSWGWKDFINRNDIHFNSKDGSIKSLIEDNRVIVGAYIRIYKYTRG